MIKAGDKVQIKPDFQDSGDRQFDWYAINNQTEDSDRITITAIKKDGKSFGVIQPTFVIRINQLDL